MNLTKNERINLLLNESVNNNKTIFKKIGSKKIHSFIGVNSYGYFYAFGSPSQIGGYIAFNKSSYKECKECIYNSLEW